MYSFSSSFSSSQAAQMSAGTPAPAPVTLPALEQEITTRTSEDAAFKSSLAATQADVDGKAAEATAATGTQ